MNPSRLAELNHQRSLVREQLAWLEREIAQESAGLTPIAGVQAPIAGGPIPIDQARPVIEGFRPDPKSAVSDTRRGCFTAIAIATALTMAGLIAIYFLRYSDRPLLFLAEKSDSPPAEKPLPSRTPLK